MLAILFYAGEKLDVEVFEREFTGDETSEKAIAGLFKMQIYFNAALQKNLVNLIINYSIPV